MSPSEVLSPSEVPPPLSLTKLQLPVFVSDRDRFTSGFQGISPSDSSFNASFPRRIDDGVVSLPLSPQIVSQAPQHVRSSETDACQPLVIVALPASLTYLGGL